MFNLSEVNFDAMSPDEQEEFLLLIRKEEFAEKAQSLTFYEFVQHFWSVLEPHTPFFENWHIGAICEHLVACYNREIRDLIINVPPRTLKSKLVDVLFPAWVWTKNPTERFLTASFAERLALRDASECRTLIRSPEYQAYYRDIFQMSSDQDTKQYYQNDKRGSRRSFGTKASIVGEGGDINILDDPNNAESKETSADLIETNFWVKGKWYSRVNNYQTCVRIVVQQRLHVMDVTGYLLEKELGFHLLKIPFRYEGEKNTTIIGWSDPREKIGEIISPRFPEEEARKLEKTLGTEAPGQLQQTPYNKEGGMFPSSRVTIVDAVPNDLTLVRYWDKAFTEGGGAYTAGVLMGIDAKSDYYILDVVRGQWDPFNRDLMMLKTASRDAERYGGVLVVTENGEGDQINIWTGGRVRICIEQEPGSTGRDSNDSLVRKLKGYKVESDKVTGDKITRAGTYSSQWGAGNVYLLRADWNEEYKSELAAFPVGKYKDQVDASSGAFNKLVNPLPPYEFNIGII